jgi:iron-sulfur cluster repair protein YtfE (RIC family)
MILSDDYKNIIKLRFNNLDMLPKSFFESYYNYISEPELFDDIIFSSFTLKDVLYYLQKSHVEYLNIWYPKIEDVTNQIQNKFGINEVTLTLNTFLVNYFNELSNHINFEEKVLYNFVDKLLEGIYVETEKVFVLNHFLETHSHAIEDDLISIQKRLINIDSTIKESQIFKELFNKFDLIHNDLKIHGLVEDEVLINKIHKYINDNF